MKNKSKSTIELHPFKIVALIESTQTVYKNGYDNSEVVPIVWYRKGIFQKEIIVKLIKLMSNL